MNQRNPRIALYGATGRVGRLVTRELVRMGSEVLLCGRSEDRLADLSREYPEIPSRSVALDDNRGLESLLEDCRVVLNCAAPSTVCGPPLVQAALAARVHYVDSTGEQGFMRTLFERYEEKARSRGVALVPAMGFDYAPGDCLARLAAQGHESVDEVAVAYAIEGSDVASASVQFASETPGGDEVVYRNRTWRPVRFEIYRGHFDFPEPFGRQPMARYGSGEVVTVPRHTRTRNVTTLITARSLVPHPGLVPLLPLLRPAVALVRQTPARRLLALVAARLPTPKRETANPTPSRFSIVAEAKGPKDTLGRADFSGHDFHGLTVASLAWGARQLAADGFDRKGALGPAAAFSPESLLDHLAARFGRWHCDA